MSKNVSKPRLKGRVSFFYKVVLQSPPVLYGRIASGRRAPTYFDKREICKKTSGRIAQLVERRAYTSVVLGSSPSGRTKNFFLYLGGPRFESLK